MEWHKQLYIFALYASYALFFAALFGFWSYAPQYLSTLESVLQLYVAGFLIIKFNPWFGKKTFDTFDRRIVFSSALFLLASSSITVFLKSKANTLLERTRKRFTRGTFLDFDSASSS